MKGSWNHRIHAGLMLLVSVAVGVILLPLLRAQPAAVHEFITGLHDWQRKGFNFLLCVLCAYTMFKLFSPRLIHLRYWWTHPPTWFAWLVGVCVVAVIDVQVGLNPRGYRASWTEWLGYAGGAILVVTLYRYFSTLSRESPWFMTVQEAVAAICRCFKTKENKKTIASNDNWHPEFIADGDWSVIEEWLRSDATAEYDFLGNRAVAERLKTLLLEGTRSIGVVGPFGAGKTSIVQWMIDGLNSRNSMSTAHRLLVSKHSCWGFETSASSIHEMLADAIKQVELRIDTFHVSSLPESYRQTFSAGGEWLDTISNLLLGKREPSEQFERLSELLGDMNSRLVIVIEDLDRNDSRSFDIQEVLAFLQQLKEYNNLSFVLTGGLESTRRIDFVKLCDHIEYLKLIDPIVATRLIKRAFERCSDTCLFPHESLGDPSIQGMWSPLAEWLVRDYDEFSLSQAVAVLLDTPRSLRHALGRTWTSWKRLHGEIDLQHLFAVNVLRFGAPECFLFLIRRWDRLTSTPEGSNNYGRDRIERVRQSIFEDWENTIRDVYWNPNAALVVLEFLLPTATLWITKEKAGAALGTFPQGIQIDRYWRRAVSETIDEAEIRDQTVIRDVRRWMEIPNLDSDLISGLITSSEYSNLWEDLATHLLGNEPDRILLVCEQTLYRICAKHGAAASRDSQGFLATWRFANGRVSNRPENCDWLKSRISDVASASIELLNSFWHYYGAPGRLSILRHQDVDEVRRHEIDVLRTMLLDGEVLARLCDARYPFVLYHLVFDPGDHNPECIADISTWTWIAPILLDALRREYVVVAVAIACLVSKRQSGGQHDVWVVDPQVLFELFANEAKEVIQQIEKLIIRIENKERRNWIVEIVKSSKIAIKDREQGEGYQTGETL